MSQESRKREFKTAGSIFVNLRRFLGIPAGSLKAEKIQSHDHESRETDQGDRQTSDKNLDDLPSYDETLLKGVLSAFLFSPRT